ncbi:MAG: tetratricopeptide repeat protein [Desulfatitalea sp.]|nr:YcaO-like family protein [Desulfatitalea sp.]NNJ99406.1 tetratricopeptide repeat protein [Desulfatitalea sp.]
MKKPTPIRFKDAFKQYRHDQDKVSSPQETVERFRQRLAHIELDILSDVVRIDKGRLDIPVYFSICGADARAAIGNYKQMGKGATPEQAQASAVMELAERFSLFSFRSDDANFIEAPRNGLKAPAMEFDHIAKSVRDVSDDLSVVSDVFADLPLKWTFAHNVTRNQVMLVPFNWFWTINQFNGSSAGNCVEEAVCQGLCEVVERHVSALVSGQRHETPSIAAASVRDPVARSLIGKYQSNGVQLYLSDFTMDMGIPSIGALAYDPSTFPAISEIVWTAGTMPSAEKALCRALTEVAQLAGDFNSSGNYEASGLPKFTDLAAAEYVMHPGASVRLDQLPNLSHDNIRVEVERCISALAERDMEVFLVDVRHKELDIPAFYTIIPGTLFRERAASPSTGMICAKIMAERFAPRTAMAYLQSFDQKLPGKYYIQFYQGKLLLDMAEYASALDHLHRAADLTPPAEDLASILTYKGICYKEMGQYPAALKALHAADRIDPQRTDTLNLMGFCNFKQQAHEEAIDCFKRVVALNPGSAIDFANIAVNYRALGNTTQAIEYYQLALALDAGLDFAREHLAQLSDSPNVK